MFILDSTVKKIVGSMLESSTTSMPEFVVSYADNTGSAFTEGSRDGAFDDTLDVDLATAPGSGTRRIVKSIFIHNLDTVSHDFIIKYDNSGTQRQTHKITLAAGETWNLDTGTSASSNISSSSTSNRLLVTYLVVGGGGAGAINGGGGGAGGLVYESDYFTLNQSYPISIGKGGGTYEDNTPSLTTADYAYNYSLVRGSQYRRTGKSGTASILSSIRALGGGGGGGGAFSANEIGKGAMSGLAGGSGGGGAHWYIGSPNPTTINEGGEAGESIQLSTQFRGQGNKGGAMASSAGINTSSPFGIYPGFSPGLGGTSGGGGGAGSAGAVPSGGDGLRIDITGVDVWYAGGGSGGTGQYITPQPNPAYVTVDGNTTRSPGGYIDRPSGIGLAGVANTGGGGGAGGYSTSPTSGYKSAGNGADGIIILRIADTYTATFSSGVTSSLDDFTVAGFKIYSVTAGSGTVTFS
jgi:hypothetical protein